MNYTAEIYMTNPRDILNELKWMDDRSLKGVEVFYVHRGAPGDFKVLMGDDIIHLGRSFIKHTDGEIPYHRIFQISKGGKVLLSRERD